MAVSRDDPAVRFLTREWAFGGLPDDEHDRRLAEYHQHVEQIRSRLRDGAGLLVEDVNLHDAVPKGWSVTEGAIVWTLVAGDLQRGYEFAELRYGNGRVPDATEEEILRFFSAQDVEVWYDEVDITADGYVHRVLMWPDGEFSVTFDALTVTRRPASPSDR